MAKAMRESDRREDALSRDRIVDAAIALLDDEGEGGLTFRALATRLATGPGAIYWHVANKSELLVAATNGVVARALEEALPDVREGAHRSPRGLARAAPHQAIRRIAAVVFATIDAHPWVGSQLSRAPWETAMLEIFERIGRQLQALGVPRRAQFTSASALLSYILGVSVQNAAQGRLLDPPVDRTEFLERVSARWKALDANEYPFTRSVAARLPAHDDLAEFLAGIDLIVAGIAPSPS